MSITPDYSLGASEVYINFARQHILHEGLTILLFAGLEQRQGRSLIESFENLSLTTSTEEEIHRLTGVAHSSA